MEITRKPPSDGVAGYVQTVRGDKAGNQQADQAHAAKANGDRVQLSDGAREVQEAMRVMNELPDIRSEKIAKLRAEVEQGTYRPDGRKIAFNMLKQSFLDEVG